MGAGVTGVAVLVEVRGVVVPVGTVVGVPFVPVGVVFGVEVGKGVHVGWSVKVAEGLLVLVPVAVRVLLTVTVKVEVLVCVGVKVNVGV